MGGDLGDPVPQRVVVAGDGGGGELGCKPALQRIRVVAKADPANAARGRRDEQPAEGARDDCERDARPRAAAAIRGRGHAQLRVGRSEEHTSELQSLAYLVCRLLLEKKKTTD